MREFSWEPKPASHHKLIIEKLDQVAKGQIKRLMLFLPPGSAKSTYTSLLFPAYWLLNNPHKLIIGASHSGSLAERFGRKVRNLVNDDRYSELFDITLMPDSKAAGRWETSNGSEYYAVGTGGSVTGRRGDLGLIDDPVKGRQDADSETVRERTWDWYRSDFRTRLKPEAAQIIIMTRWHEDDLAGRILPDDYDGRSGPVIARDGEIWEVINLPMVARENDALGRKPGELLWPEWFTPEWVVQEKKSQGPRDWQSLYQGLPTIEEGEYFKRDDVQWYERRPSHMKYYLFGDYAVTEDGGDFTEIGVAGVSPKDEIYLVDWFRGQVDSLEVVETLLDMVERWEPLVSIAESGVIRRALEPIIKKRMRSRKAFTRLEWLPTHSDKVAMARSIQAMTQLGIVHFPKDKDWAEPLIRQMTSFPNGRWDDGVDALGILGRYIDRIWKGRKPEKVKPFGKVPRPKINPGFKISDMMDDPYEARY